MAEIRDLIDPNSVFENGFDRKKMMALLHEPDSAKSMFRAIEGFKEKKKLI